MTSTPITLRYPIVIEGTTLNQISLRRPQVRDVMAVKDLPNQADQELELLSMLVEPHLNRQSLLTLDLQDYRAIQAVLASIMGGVADIGQIAKS